jgi:PAS domain S-box-containing protein
MAASAVGLLALGFLFFGLFDLPRQQRDATREVSHALEVLGVAAALEAHVERMTNEGRGYLNLPDLAALARTEAVIAQVYQDVAALRALTADSSAQQAMLDQLQPVIDARTAILRRTLALKAAGDQAGVDAMMRRQEGRAMMVDIVATIERLRAEETRLLAERRAAADVAARVMVAALVACAALAACSLFLAVTLVIRHRRDRASVSDLRRTEALLRAIMQATPGHIYAKDLQGRMIAANAAVLDFLGKPWSALEGRTDRDYLDDPAEAEAIMANDRLVIESGRTQVLEERVGTDGEAPRVWLSSKTPMRDAEGAIVGMVGMSVDITDRKRAEERLLAFNASLEASVAARTAQIAASEARQRAYFNHSPIGMVVMRVGETGDFVLEDINPAARLAFGFPPDSAPGLTPAELWPELVARDKQQKMQACATRREVIEYTVTREIGGKPRLLDIVLAPLLDDGVEARFVLICVHDVTRQRDLERQVMEQAERQAEAAEREMALFSNSPDELFVVRVEDTAGEPRFTYEAFSPAVEGATGFSPRDMIGRAPQDIMAPSVALPVLDNYRRCLREQTTIKFSATRALPIGLRDVEGWVTPVRNPTTGRVNRLVGMVRDVTERNRMEAALRQGQKMEAIGRLAAGVAHDFNNILQAIISGLDLVIEEAPAGTQAHDVAVVALGAAMRGSHLTHHLLSYARKQMLWPQAIDLGSFLPEIKSLLARTLGPHIAIELRLHQTRDGAPQAVVDPGELQTALLNLAINAAQAMPKGGQLHIDARQDTAAGQSWAEITVTDTGAGMDEATLAQAVEPFFSTKGVGGAGLGLSMVQGFVEQSGGSLHIASTPGRGTHVTLRLPAASTAGLRAPPEPAGPMRGTGRILLVDDATDVLVTVGALLVKAGFDVVRAESGERALDVLADDPHFDALVADYAMPGLDGTDLIAQTRLLKPGLPALVITGFASIGEGEAAAEAMAVLHKPFQRQDLIAALRRLMQHRDPAEIRAEADARHSLRA